MAKIVGDYSKIARLDYQCDDPFHGNPMSVALAILQMQNYLATGVDHGPLSQRYLTLKQGNISQWDQFDPNHKISNPLLAWEWCRSIGSCRMSLCPETAKRITPTMDVEAARYKRPIALKNLNDLPDYPAAKRQMVNNPGDAILLSTDGWDTRALMGFDEPTGKVICLTFYQKSFIPTQIARWIPGMTKPSPARIELLDDTQAAALWQSQLYNQHEPPASYMAAFLYWNG